MDIVTLAAARKYAYRSMLWRKTTSGNPVSVYPVPESPLYPKVGGTFTQAGTGDPSPSNIRPITPWLASGGTEKVKRTGKNILESGTAVSQVGLYGGVYLITKACMVAGKTYVISFDTPNSGFTVALNSSGITPIDFAVVLDGTRKSMRFTCLVTGDTPGAVIYRDSATSETPTGLVTNVQIEEGSTATPYEPYSEQEITLTAPQEIPAGWMDNEGNGQKTHKIVVLTGGENWSKVTGKPVYELLFGTEKAIDVNGIQSAMSHYISGSALNVLGGTANKRYTLGSTQISGGNYLYINDADIADLIAWKAYLAAQHTAGTPVTIAYKITSTTTVGVYAPVALTITPNPLTALPQVDRVTPRANVLTASTGNVELTYAKSPIRESDDIAAAIAAL